MNEIIETIKANAAGAKTATVNKSGKFPVLVINDEYGNTHHVTFKVSMKDASVTEAEKFIADLQAKGDRVDAKA